MDFGVSYLTNSFSSGNGTQIYLTGKASWNHRGQVSSRRNMEVGQLIFRSEAVIDSWYERLSSPFARLRRARAL